MEADHGDCDTFDLVRSSYIFHLGETGSHDQSGAAAAAAAAAAAMSLSLSWLHHVLLKICTEYSTHTKPF